MATLLIILAGLGIGGLPEVTAQTWVKCGGVEICEAGTSCQAEVLQGAAHAEARRADDDPAYFTLASATSTLPERWIVTTCLTFDLRAYSAGDVADASVEVCYFPPCAASAVYDVQVVDELGDRRAFCTTSTTCSETEITSATATKYDIDVSIPHTTVKSWICANAKVYEDWDDDGSWSDNEMSHAFQCDDTDNHIGIGP